MKRALLSGLFTLLLAFICSTVHAITINGQAGWFEAAYVEFSLSSSYDGYNVYYSTNKSTWTKIDAALVRKYSDHGRADAVGLAAGTYYMKVVPTSNGTEQTSAAVTSSALTVKAHDRTGFAFMGNQMPGAYESDGTLKSNAIVVYVTNDNKNSVEANITYTNKGVTQTATGLLAILTAYKKGYETRPLCIRIIGNVTDSNFNFLDFTNGNAATDIDAASDFKGDIMITSNKKDLGGVTIEGIGKDAVANGWGIRFKGLNYGEVRNLGFMNCNSDEGDDVGLQQDNNYCWVHNCDMFYGDAGSDKDQVKGDGALDCKKSNYITFSYNHFWDCGKCNLLGLSEGTVSTASSPYYITYHHNWYDHSDSRHPRVRYYNAHIYNNYYDGNAKYGAGSTLGSSLYMENNYFRSCKFPMMISLQGSDVYAGTTTRDPTNYGTFSKEAGGMIKAYNNTMTGTYTFIPYGASTYILKGSSTSIGSIDSSADFDAYVVSSASTKVPTSVTSYSGSNYYSNFDTNSSVMYSYTAEEPADAVTTIQGTYGAGRMQQGDFEWTFTDSDDTSSDVNTSLKSALTNYTNSDFVGLFSDDTSSSGGDEEEEEPETPATSTDATLKSLTVTGYSLAFSSSTTSYSVTLAYDAESAPTVSAVANNSNATVSIKQATSTTGTATVTVTAEDGTTKKIYTVQFSLGSEPAAEGSSISSAMTLNIGDGTNAYKSYITGTFNTSNSGTATYGGVTNSTLSIKMESSTSLSFTTTKAFTMTFVAGSTETASFKLDGTTVKASSGNTVSVNVAAGSHEMTKSSAINLFFLDFAAVETEEEDTQTESDDATLSALNVSGYTLDPTFSASTTVYSVELAAGSTSVPTITATANYALATVNIDTESCSPAGQAVIKVTAENGDTKNYYINFTVATAYYTVSASANTGGTAEVDPSGSVAEGTSVTFTATASNGYTFSKWSDNSTENPYTVTVTGDLALTATFAAQGETTTLFSANVTSAPSDVVPAAASSTLDMADYVSINGGTMTFYNGKTSEYNVINANSTYMKFGGSNQYYKIVLNTALAEGDVISYSTTDNYELSFTTTTTRATTPATSSHTYTVTSSDGLAGATTIYIWRASSNNTIFNNLTITRTSTSEALELTDGEEYTADEDKTYEDGVTYTRNFSSTLVNKWTSLYVPFAIDVAEYTDQFDIAEIFAFCPVYDTDEDGEVTADDDDYLIVFKMTSGTTVPNKPYLIRAKASGDVEIAAADNKAYAAPATNGSVNCATTKTKYTIYGTYSPVTANADNNYWYMNTSGSVAHKTSGSTTVKSNRWYMTTESLDSNYGSSLSAKEIGICVLGEDVSTGIVNVNENGNKNDNGNAIYTLGGVKVKGGNLPAGIYIRGGKTIIVK